MREGPCAAAGAVVMSAVMREGNCFGGAFGLVLGLVAPLAVAVVLVAFRARRARASAEAGRSEIRRIHRLAEQVATDEEPADVILAAEAELTDLLDLVRCRFEAPPYDELLPRLERGGLPETTDPRAAGTRVELPADGVELQVLARGQPVGRFVLLPTPGGTLSLEQRVVAVALADQVGSVLSAHQGQVRRQGSYG